MRNKITLTTTANKTLESSETSRTSRRSLQNTASQLATSMFFSLRESGKNIRHTFSAFSNPLSNSQNLGSDELMTPPGSPTSQAQAQALASDSDELRISLDSPTQTGNLENNGLLLSGRPAFIYNNNAPLYEQEYLTPEFENSETIEPREQQIENFRDSLSSREITLTTQMHNALIQLDSATCSKIISSLNIILELNPNKEIVQTERIPSEVNDNLEASSYYKSIHYTLQTVYNHQSLLSIERGYGANLSSKAVDILGGSALKIISPLLGLIPTAVAAGMQRIQDVQETNNAQNFLKNVADGTTVNFNEINKALSIRLALAHIIRKQDSSLNDTLNELEENKKIKNTFETQQDDSTKTDNSSGSHIISNLKTLYGGIRLIACSTGRAFNGITAFITKDNINPERIIESTKKWSSKKIEGSKEWALEKARDFNLYPEDHFQNDPDGQTANLHANILIAYLCKADLKEELKNSGGLTTENIIDHLTEILIGENANTFIKKEIDQNRSQFSWQSQINQAQPTHTSYQSGNNFSSRRDRNILMLEAGEEEEKEEPRFTRLSNSSGNFDEQGHTPKLEIEGILSSNIEIPEDSSFNQSKLLEEVRKLSATLYEQTKILHEQTKTIATLKMQVQQNQHDIQVLQKENEALKEKENESKAKTTTAADRRAIPAPIETHLEPRPSEQSTPTPQAKEKLKHAQQRRNQRKNDLLSGIH